MRFLCAFVLAGLLCVLSATLYAGPSSAIVPLVTPSQTPIVHDIKIVCGDFGNGYTCRSEPGAVRRGKMRKIPGSGSSDSGGPFGGSEDPDALPPASGDAGTTQAPSAAPTTCPVNSELLGGHCIPYTQTCRQGLAANAAPQVCRAAEEKLVCNFRSDGLKDCCCRTYSKF